MQDKIRPKTETVVSYHPSFDPETQLEPLLNTWKGAPKQLEVLLAFLHFQQSNPFVSQSQLLNKANAASAAITSLCEKNVLQVQKQVKDRITLMPKKCFIDFEFSDVQKIAYDQILDSFQQHQVTLLHGVTGSGKTLLYIKLIEKYLKEGKQILYLLPEIALTAQIIRRLQQHFGGHVSIYHSRFNDQERVELWNKIRNREVSILLGARSALFLPFDDLGLVIVDEEHDSSYKQQDPSPRYHAKDAAIFYASMFGAKTLLGSGTPSLESYWNASSGKFGLVQLNSRFGGLLLPEIKMVHALDGKTKGRVIITDELKAAIDEALLNDKQVILFQNRRGYHPYMICGACGDIPKCNHCDVSLTLHKYSNKLHCHYCGSTYPKLIQCKACGSVKWNEKNFGTERIEEELELLFPNARIARMDVDSVRGKTAHETLITQFERKEIDILVGTQMVVKGLDFDDVSLVGVLDADGLTSFADFRANERAFQLMEQVSGRAGRKGKQGNVIIQALNLNHPILSLVSAHDFKGMYEREISERKQFHYPPFSRLIQLTIRHKDELKLRAASEKLAASLRIDFKDKIIGPAAPIISRIRDQYLMEIMIKLPKDNLLAKYKQAVKNHIDLLIQEQQYRSIFIAIDIDPF
jgi:primosomal protein N' (replication factor Y)